MTNHNLPEAEAAEMHRALLQWQAEGVKNPIIPAYQDVDGDGRVDYYGLDAFGQLTLTDASSGTDVSLPHAEVGP